MSNLPKPNSFLFDFVQADFLANSIFYMPKERKNAFSSKKSSITLEQTAILCYSIIAADIKNRSLQFNTTSRFHPYYNIKNLNSTYLLRFLSLIPKAGCDNGAYCTYTRDIDMIAIHINSGTAIISFLPYTAKERNDCIEQVT